MAAKSSGASGGPGFRLATFPKEFEKSLWETFDKRYYSILLTTFIVFYGFAFLMASKNWVLSQDQIDALKKRVIEKVYDTAFVPEEEPVEDETGIGEVPAEEEATPEVSERGRERVEESQTQKAERRRRTQADLENRSRQMQQEVASQGILAIATAAGGSGAGNVAYNDVLQDLAGGAGGVGDIGEVVEGTAGIRTAGSPGDRTRAAKGSGFRTDGGASGIDGLISGGSVSGSSSFERRGKISLASENVKLTAGAGSRDADAITSSINQQSASVEYCYQKRAKVNPNLKGRIDIEIEIAATGRVSRVRTLKSTLGDKRLDSCIERAVKRWRFGAVDNGNVKIRVPFIF